VQLPLPELSSYSRRSFSPLIIKYLIPYSHEFGKVVCHWNISRAVKRCLLNYPASATVRAYQRKPRNLNPTVPRIYHLMKWLAGMLNSCPTNNDSEMALGQVNREESLSMIIYFRYTSTTTGTPEVRGT
jgi:hypothetical protein